MKKQFKKIIHSKKTSLFLSIIFCFLFIGVVSVYAQESSKGADQGWTFGLFKDGLMFVIDWLGQAYIKIMSWIMWMAGMFLNMSVFVGIRSMSAIISGSDAIETGWKIFRDLINILFIFGLLYVSIITILKGWGESSKKMLGNIIMAAVLINFSWFFTATLIDASNILTIKIYDSMETCSATVANMAIEEKGLSNCFMEALNLQTAYNEGSLVNTDGETLGPLDVFTYYMIAGTFILIAAVVFFATGVVILTRFITLIILLITSPVMFLGMIIPNFKKMSSDWFSKLSSALISLPVMFTFIYVTYKMLLETNILSTIGINPNGSFQAVISTGVNHFGVIINFIVIIGFLIASIIVSQKAGAIGGSAATKAGGNIVIGGAARVGRRVVGGAGNRMANSEKYKKLASSDKFIDRMRGKAVIRGGNLAAKSSLDMRKAPGVGATLKAASVDLGSAKKGGFKKDSEDRVKKLEDDNKLFERKEYSPEERSTINTDNFDKEVDKIKFKENKRAIENAENEITEKQKDINYARSEIERTKRESGKDSDDFVTATNLLNDAEIKYSSALAKKEKADKELIGMQEKALKTQGIKSRYESKNKLIKAFDSITARNKSTKDFIEKIEKELKKGDSEKNIDKIIKGISDQSKPSEKSGSEGGDGGNK